MRTGPKTKIKITSGGLLNSFGYEKLRTPAVVELYPNQIAILAASGVQFEYISEKPAHKEEPSKLIRKSFPKRDAQVLQQNVD